MKSKKRMDVAEKLAWELQKEEEIRSNLYENGEIIDDNQKGNQLLDANVNEQGKEQEFDKKIQKQQIQPVFWTNALIEVKYLDWHEAVASLHKLIETTQQIYVTQKLKAIEYDKMATKSQLEYLALLNQRFAEQAELQKQRDEIDRRLEQQRILFQAKQEEMNKRIEQEEEIRRKEEEREKEKEEKEREKNKVELEEYHRALREMQYREALELAELEEQARIEREKQGIINKERVEYRQKEYEQQKAQQQEKEIARIEAEAEKERMLEKIREQVRIYAKDDPERLLQPTESSKAAMEAEEWRRADLFAINGYTDDQMFADPRFHFQFLLNERGVGQSEYAKEIMAKIPPQRPPRIDALTSDQKAVEIKSRKDNIFLPIFGKKSE
ncbi:MAG: hypothetical protein EZS28_013653 [Streblomastix strix]|uniref:Coiled-coil domain-containing protein n=1 Tax=Streblomastix strix TaxID=222440 RepID=A0A5J4W7A9_9EUKA|nr:MAG: hypothetical protein EZS28_013653 [Streblomastix strix]